MNKKVLMLTLIPLVLGMITANASAKAITFTSVDNDVITDNVRFEPFPGFLVKSRVMLGNHLMFQTVQDGSQNFHVVVKGVNVANLHNEYWQWNEVTQEWICIWEYSQKGLMINVDNELDIALPLETQTAIDIEISHNTVESIMRDPSTGEIIYIDYTNIILHIVMKMLNGELQFEKYWEIVKS